MLRNMSRISFNYVEKLWVLIVESCCGLDELIAITCNMFDRPNDDVYWRFVLFVLC
jgi:hypothetical protein